MEELVSRACPALSGLKGLSIRGRSLYCLSIILSLEKLKECVINGGEFEEQHVQLHVHKVSVNEYIKQAA